MHRHPTHAPPIPTVVETEIKHKSEEDDDANNNNFVHYAHHDNCEAGFSHLPVMARPYYEDRGARSMSPRHLQPPEVAIVHGCRVPGLSSLVRTKSSFLFDEQRRELQEQMNFPRGLSNELGKTRSLFPARFWILDNSGSMLNNDGTIVRNGARVTCTRWKELEETVVYHAELAAILQATSHFRFLNDPGVRVAPREFSIADQGKDAMDETRNIKQIMQQTKPYGPTPLTRHLVEIVDLVSTMEGTMRQKGLQATVIIATDGLPTSSEGETSDHINSEFINVLSQLQTLPVWVVIRLCTDEKAVVDFYNALDSVLELPLEVLDDHLNEAREINHFNSWLNYALPLHRCREIGYQHRIFDLLDERPLNKDEVKEFCLLLLGAEYFTDCPDVHSDWTYFLKYLTNILKREKQQWNPLTQKMAPWIDVSHLKKTFGSSILGRLMHKTHNA